MIWILLAAAAGNPPPGGWCSLSEIPGLQLSIGYATAQNFTGTILPGYGSASAWLSCPAAEALARVHLTLAPQAYGIVVFDAYRPVRASQGMVAWAERTGNSWVIDQGFVAPASGHNRGHTVDVGLYNLGSGTIVDMGTPWDSFTAAAATAAAASSEVADRRRALTAAMAAQGFVNYAKEWWHFSRPGDAQPALDVPYGACEPAAFAKLTPNDPGWIGVACP